MEGGHKYHCLNCLKSWYFLACITIININFDITFSDFLAIQLERYNSSGWSPFRRPYSTCLQHKFVLVLCGLFSCYHFFVTQLTIKDTWFTYPRNFVIVFLLLRNFHKSGQISQQFLTSQLENVITCIPRTQLLT